MRRICQPVFLIVMMGQPVSRANCERENQDIFDDLETTVQNTEKKIVPKCC